MLLDYTDRRLFFKLLDQNKKKTGGLLHINICISEPLLNDDVPVKQEKWLIIDEYNANIYSLLASAKLVPQSMANYQPAPASSPQALTPPSIQSPAPSPVVAEQLPNPNRSPPANSAEENVPAPAPAPAPKAEKAEEENELDKAEADLNKYAKLCYYLFHFLVLTEFQKRGQHCLQYGTRNRNWPCEFGDCRLSWISTR